MVYIIMMVYGFCVFFFSTFFIFSMQFPKYIANFEDTVRPRALIYFQFT